MKCRYDKCPRPEEELNSGNMHTECYWKWSHEAFDNSENKKTEIEQKAEILKQLLAQCKTPAERSVVLRDYFVKNIYTPTAPYSPVAKGVN